MSSVPKKRTRKCTIQNETKVQNNFECKLNELIIILVEANEILEHFTHDESMNEIYKNITNFIDILSNKTKQAKQMDNHENDENEEDGEDINDEDSWSDTCSSHSSDRDFIVSDNEEDGDAEYVPSGSSSSSGSSSENQSDEES